MERELYVAVINGDLAPLTFIFAEDPFILERLASTEFNGSPLHIAAARGQVDVVEMLLSIKPDLAEVQDSLQRSPLHVAAAKGHVEIVRLLIKESPNMCLACDLDGRTPLHAAATKGMVDVVRVLIPASTEASWIKVGKYGETVLHLCVALQKWEVLKLLMDNVQDKDAVSAKDGKGNTVLHLALKDKEYQIADHLVQICKVDVNVTNDYMYTALDILLNQSKYEPQEPQNIQITLEILRKAGALRGKDVLVSKGKWLDRRFVSFMVVASLMAIMAFQVGGSPPGGVWQRDSDTYKAGEAVVASTYSRSYKYFIRINTIGFVMSLTTILLLISSLPFRKHPLVLLALVVTMWVTVTSMAFTYAFAIVVVTPKKDRQHLILTIAVAVVVWCGVLTFIFFAMRETTFCRQRILKCLNGGRENFTSRSLPNHYF